MKTCTVTDTCGDKYIFYGQEKTGCTYMMSQTDKWTNNYRKLHKKPMVRMRGIYKVWLGRV